MTRRQEGPVALQRKHPLAIRWFHWLNFPILAVMIWSGLLIYWANDVYGIGSARVNPDTYEVQHSVIHFFPHPMPDRSGVFQLAAPNWFPKAWTTVVPDDDDKKPPHRYVYELQSRLAEGMGWHFTFMWFFTLNGIAYVLYLGLSREWKLLLPNRKSFKDALHVVAHDLFLTKKPLPRAKFNGAQRFAYTTIILMGGLAVLSGLAIYKPTQLNWLTGLFGGYEVARFIHFWLMMGFVAFFAVHVLQVIRAGWNNFRAMVTGYELVPPPLVEEPSAVGEAG